MHTWKQDLTLQEVSTADGLFYHGYDGYGLVEGMSQVWNIYVRYGIDEGLEYLINVGGEKY